MEMVKKVLTVEEIEKLGEYFTNLEEEHFDVVEKYGYCLDLVPDAAYDKMDYANEVFSTIAEAMYEEHYDISTGRPLTVTLCREYADYIDSIVA